MTYNYQLSSSSNTLLRKLKSSRAHDKSDPVYSIGVAPDEITAKLIDTRKRFSDELGARLRAKKIGFAQINSTELHFAGQRLFDRWTILNIDIARLADVNKVLEELPASVATVHGIEHENSGGRICVKFNVDIKKNHVDYYDLIVRIMLVLQCFSFLMWTLSIMYGIYHPQWTNGFASVFAAPCSHFRLLYYFDLLQAPCTHLTCYFFDRISNLGSMCQ